MYSAFVEWSIPRMAIRSRWFIALLKSFIYFLIFCLVAPCIIESGYLHLQLLPLNCLFLPSVLHFCFMYLGALLLGTYIVITVIPSWWIEPIIIIKCPSLSLITETFVLRSFLPNICRATQLFKLTTAFLSFAGYIFIHPFTFNPFLSLNLNCVSYRQYIVGSCFLFFNTVWHLCLLIGLLNAFTFSFVIDIAGCTSAILLCVFCMSHVFFSFFIPPLWLSFALSVTFYFL